MTENETFTRQGWSAGARSPGKWFGTAALAAAMYVVFALVFDDWFGFFTIAMVVLAVICVVQGLRALVGAGQPKAPLE